MAHLFRKTITRYVDATGNHGSPDTPGAKKVKELSRKWYCQGLPNQPPKKAFPLAADKRPALQMLAELERKAERGDTELGGPEVEQGKRPLSEHLEEFLAHLKAPNLSEKHRSVLRQRITDASEGCGFQFPRQITVECLEAYLAKCLRNPRMI
jgi:hypothetical protein